MMTKKPLEAVVRKLNSKSVAQRVKAVEALSAFDFDDASAFLTKALKDANPHVRRQAAVSLGAFKDYRAVAPLIKAMKDEDPGVREAVAQSFKKIAIESEGGNPARSLEELSEQIPTGIEGQWPSSEQSANEGGEVFREWAVWATGQLAEGFSPRQTAEQRSVAFTCLNCGEETTLSRPPTFCPNCGRPMRP